MHGEVWLPPRDTNLSLRRSALRSRQKRAPGRLCLLRLPSSKINRRPLNCDQRFCGTSILFLVPPGLTHLKSFTRRRRLELRQSHVRVGLFLSERGHRWAHWPQRSRFVSVASERGLLFKGSNRAGTGSGLLKKQVKKHAQARPGTAVGQRMRHTQGGRFPRSVLLGALCSVHVSSSDLGKVSLKLSLCGLGAACPRTHPRFQMDLGGACHPPWQGLIWSLNPMSSAGPAVQ